MCWGFVLSQGAASQIIVRMINCHNFLVMAKVTSKHLIYTFGDLSMRIALVLRRCCSTTMAETTTNETLYLVAHNLSQSSIKCSWRMPMNTQTQPFFMRKSKLKQLQSSAELMGKRRCHIEDEVAVKRQNAKRCRRRSECRR